MKIISHFDYLWISKMKDILFNDYESIFQKICVIKKILLS